MPEKKIQKQNVGNAGEYYLAARLSALDFIVTITLGRAERYDILAISPKGRVIKTSVKATQNDNAMAFQLSAKDEKGQEEDFYYAFVKLNGFNKEPDFWIVPSEVVCTIIIEAHQKWLRTPGRNNKKHRDIKMRKLHIEVPVNERHLYPPNWGKEIQKYYKNLNQML